MAKASKIENRKAWRQLSERVSQDSFFVGSALRDFANRHKLNEEDLAAWLDCSVVDLQRLTVCRLPDDEQDTFQRDVESLARFTSCNGDRLIELFREVCAVRSLRQGTTEGHILMAARDRRLPDKDKS
jgi:hypothetical protein